MRCRILTPIAHACRRSQHAARPEVIQGLKQRTLLLVTTLTIDFAGTSLMCACHVSTRHIERAGFHHSLGSINPRRLETREAFSCLPKSPKAQMAVQ